jgi:hypothetical protein
MPNTLKRMVQAKHIAALLIAACLASTAAAAAPFEAPSVAEKVTIEPRGRAYLFRGLIALIDWGMDELAQRINRTGVTADINSHLMWPVVANQAISDYRRDPEPITVIGHSIGGDSAVAFARYLDAADIPVNLLVTYDPTRFADNVPSNVERYINLYQSSSILGGADLVQGRGFHGHYASFDLDNRPEIIHINMDKFDRIQEQLVDKIKALATTPASAEGEAAPLHIAIPAAALIELWDSGLPVLARAGDTLQTLAATYHVPVWALAQVNRTSEQAALTKGERIIVPRYLVPRAGPRSVSSNAPTGR